MVWCVVSCDRILSVQLVLSACGFVREEGGLLHYKELAIVVYVYRHYRSSWSCEVILYHAICRVIRRPQFYELQITGRGVFQGKIRRPVVCLCITVEIHKLRDFGSAKLPRLPCTGGPGLSSSWYPDGTGSPAPKVSSWVRI
jgi:hypothetical protein